MKKDHPDVQKRQEKREKVHDFIVKASKYVTTKKFHEELKKEKPTLEGSRILEQHSQDRKGRRLTKTEGSFKGGGIAAGMRRFNRGGKV